MNKRVKIVLWIFVALLLTQCSQPSSNSKSTTFISPKDSNFIYVGRIDFTHPQSLRFAYSGTSIRFRFEGSVCILHLKNKSLAKDSEGNFLKNYYTVIVDRGKPQLITVSNEDEKVKLKKMGKGIHDVLIFKRTEAMVGEGIFEGIEIEKDKKMLPVVDTKIRKIEFIGNSITCGYGNEGASKDCHFSPETENGYLAYGAITARKLNADYLAVAYSGKGIYRNFDGSMSNTLSLLYDRIFPDSAQSPKWNYKKWQPNVVVLNLGTNDFAKGLPDSVIFVNTYVNFLKRLRSYYPEAHILCTEGPMSNDLYPANLNAFTKVKNYIIASKNKMSLIGEKKVSTFFPTPQEASDYGCDYHPNLKRHEKMAEEFTKEIKTIMKW
jgi:lysophospholipase L1-like esterase